MTTSDCSVNRDVILKHFLDTTPWADDVREHYVGCTSCIIEVTKALSRRVDAFSEARGASGLGDQEEPALSAVVRRSLEGSLQLLQREFGISHEPRTRRPGVPWEVFALLVLVRARQKFGYRSGSGEAVSPPPTPTQFPFDITAGGKQVELPPAAAERYFAPAVPNPKFTLILFAVEGGYQPVVQMSPAPNRGEPAHIVLTFPGEIVREFFVPSGPPESTESATSARGVILPASVLGDLDKGWQGTLELR